jgi:hypothetical protein
MEITAKPRHRGWLRVLRAVVVIGAMWGVALLIPPALGLQTHVVDDNAMADTHARGSLVFDERIAPMQLAVGDVVTFVPPDAEPGAGQVTRRVVAIGDTHFSTRGDVGADVDPWLVPLSDDGLERVAFSLPWLGYPVVAISAVTIPPWVPATLVIGLVAVLLVLRRGSRPADGAESAVPAGAVRGASAAAVTPPLT